VTSAANKLRAINPDVTVKEFHLRAEASNILDLIKDYDFVVDGTDNFAAKFLINDACVLGNKPFSHAGILRFDGQLMTVRPGISASYRCVSTSLRASGCALLFAGGVLGAVAGVVGCLQATEALKSLFGSGRPLDDTLLVWNALRMDFAR